MWPTRRYPAPTFLCEVLALFVTAPTVTALCFWLLNRDLPPAISGILVIFWVLAVPVCLLPHLLARRLAVAALRWEWASEVLVTRGPQPPVPPLFPPENGPPFA